MSNTTYEILKQKVTDLAHAYYTLDKPKVSDAKAYSPERFLSSQVLSQRAGITIKS